MEKTQLINDFFTDIIIDHRITPSHIALYTALIHIDLTGEQTGEIYVFSRQVMPLAKLSSSATYRKCIRDLKTFGYIDYIPSFSGVIGSLIRLGTKHMDHLPSKKSIR